MHYFEVSIPLMCWKQLQDIIMNPLLQLLYYPAIPSDMPFYILPVARLLFYGIFSNVAVSFDTRIQLPQLLTISGKFLRNLRVSTFA